MKKQMVSAAAVIAAGLSSFVLAAPAGAACASIGAGLTIGDKSQCSATFGNIAIVPDKGSAHVLGGIGNSAIAWGVNNNTAAIVGSPIPNADNTLNLFNSAIALGDNSSTLSAGFVSASLGAGRNATAFSAGLGSIAVDAGDNTYKGKGSATAVGLANRAINLGGDNTAVVTSAFPPVLDLSGAQPNIDIGNNSVINIGKGNFGAVQGGFSNGVYQIGDRNLGAAGGVLSNLIQVGNRNAQTVVGNLALGNTFGDDNRNNLTGGPTENPDAPLPALHPNLSMSNVFGNGNKVDVEGNADLTNVFGNGNKVGVQGNRNITSVFGDGNKVTPKKWNGAGIEGDNNITTSFGNQNRLRVFGNGNLTTNFGNRSTMKSFGDNNVNASAGDDKTSIKSSDDS